MTLITVRVDGAPEKKHEQTVSLPANVIIDVEAPDQRLQRVVLFIDPRGSLTVKEFDSRNGRSV